MKKFTALIIVLTFTVIASSSILGETAAQESIQESAPAFTVGRLVIAGSIEDREPVGIVNVFASATEKVYCFLEAQDIAEDTSVTFVWYFGEKEMAKVELPLSQGSRWRTYSSKRLAGLKGDWKVELQDAAGAVLQTVEFKVE